MTPAPISLSLAAPAYDESAGIEGVVRGWLEYLEQDPGVRAFEIVVCDDGSRDGTGDILARLASEHASVRVVRFPANVGAAAALRAAIAATVHDWVLLIDSDGQFPIGNLARLLETARHTGAGAVLGIREKRDSRAARFGTWSSGAACNIVHGTHLRDFNSALKLVQGPLVRSLCLEARGLNYSTEITSRLLERNVRIAEVEIIHEPRTSGQSSLRFGSGARDRLLFVAYIALRQLLLRATVLTRPQ